MTIHIPSTQKEISQKKFEEYQNYCKLIQWGRENPVRFASYIFGIEMIDYQKWSFMQAGLSHMFYGYVAEAQVKLRRLHFFDD